MFKVVSADSGLVGITHMVAIVKKEGERVGVHKGHGP